MDRWDQARAEDAVDWSAMSDVVRALRKVAKWPLMQGFENVRPESYNGELFCLQTMFWCLSTGVESLTCQIRIDVAGSSLEQPVTSIL